MQWFGRNASARYALIDDRGVRREALPTPELDAPAALKERLTEVPSLTDRLRLDQVIVYCSVPVGVVLLGMVVRQLGTGLPSQLLSGAVCFIAVVCSSFLYSRTAYAREVRQRQARVFLSALRCPCCGYDLRRLSAAADGCTECSECGAAWKLDRGNAIDDLEELEPSEEKPRTFLAGWITRRSVIDASGRSVRLTHPIVALDEPRRWHELDRDVQKRLKRRLWCVGLAKRLLLLPFAVLLLYVWTSGYVLAAAKGLSAAAPTPAGNNQWIDMMWHIVSVLGTVAIWAAGLSLVIKPDVGNTKAIIDLWLDESLCPSCAGPLDWEKLRRGDLARCDSCGSTWGRIGKATLHDVV